MAALAQNPAKVVEYATDVNLPLEYAMQVLDKNHTGLISTQQIANAPVLLKFLPLSHSLLRTNNSLTPHPNDPEYRASQAMDHPQT
jgi:hypothetical protein